MKYDSVGRYEIMYEFSNLDTLADLTWNLRNF